MTDSLKVQLQVITAQYDHLKLECDGLTRVLSYVLTHNNITHHIVVGKIVNLKQQEEMHPHYWIVVPRYPEAFIVDYRAKMWLDQRRRKKYVPHGVFMLSEYPQVKYSGNVQHITRLDSVLFRILTGGMEVATL